LYEACDVVELGLEIAGLRTGILTGDPGVAGVVRERYKDFLSEGTPGWRIEMRAEPARGPLFGGDVVVRRDGDRQRFSVQRGDFAGTLDLRQRSGTVTLADVHEASIDSFLRIAYSLALLDVGGLVLHAASLVRSRMARVFCGRSGSGKTTVARLSPDATLLSDELSIVRVLDKRARCYGTPFSGALGRAGEGRAAPLGGIYFLRHDSRHAVEAVKPRQALERLLPNVLFFAREAELTARVLGVAADLVEAVPCFDLSFRLDPGFWEVIERA
jgi:hypothetical protein